MKNKVLFIYVPTFGYHKKIEKALIESNFVVTTKYIYKYNLFHNFLLRISSMLLKYYSDYKFKRFINEICSNKYDFIFFLQAFHLKEEYLLKLRILYPDANFILYNWDSLKYFNYYPLIKLFDKVFSYDPVDCNNYNEVEYLPLFYSINQNRVNDKAIDISFIGSYSSHQRYEMLNLFKIIIKNHQLSSFFYVYISFRTWVKYLLSGIIITDCHFSPLKYSKMKSILAQSKVVIDMPNPINNGLTMRTFETIGSHSKLITTNQNVRNADFFHPNNIYIIENFRDIKVNEVLLFLMKPFIYNEDFKKYHINNWVNLIIKYEV